MSRFIVPPLLLVVGYFDFVSSKSDGFERQFRLPFPNQEIAESLLEVVPLSLSVCVRNAPPNYHSHVVNTEASLALHPFAQKNVPRCERMAVRRILALHDNSGAANPEQFRHR